MRKDFSSSQVGEEQSTAKDEEDVSLVQVPRMSSDPPDTLSYVRLICATQDSRSRGP